MPLLRYMCATSARPATRWGFVRSTSTCRPTTSQAELFALIDRLNADPDVHGILVQSPLPDHIDEDALVDRIDPGKDVDGFQAINVGRLALRRFGLRPCTPKGVMTLLGHTDRPVRGQHAVVVGVSNHVGRPLVLELMIAGCTTTCCHRFTRDLESFVRQADILIVAVGKAGLVQGRVDQARRGGDRRRHQPAGRWPSGRRRGFRRGGRTRQLDHAGARRRRPDDRGHADGKHA